jgi:class 3 adenylate cyclase/pimeloyl-ACP methyl ester carboxylesterase
MNPPGVSYIEREGAQLAYQVYGDGPAEYLIIHAESAHLDILWTDPEFNAALSRTGRHGRVVMLQRRGVGLSDGLDYVPTLEQQADDLLAVMDAEGLQAPRILAVATASAAAALLAAQAPARVRNLTIFMGGFGFNYHPGISEEERRAVRELFDEWVDNWGTGPWLRLWDPVLDTASNRRVMGLAERSAMTRSEARAWLDWYCDLQIDDVLRAIQVPTRLVSPPNGVMSPRWLEYYAGMIPHSTHTVLPELARGASMGDAWEPLTDILLGDDPEDQGPAEDQRTFATVLFTDLVGSTELLGRLGDEEYQRVRRRHEREARLAVDEMGGQLIDVAGDGTFSTFDGPSQAVRCAERISREAVEAGVGVRCGLHSGEVQRDGAAVTGMTVHIGARVMAQAAAGEVLMCGAVVGLVGGSGLTFTPLGERSLKGVPGTWELFALAHAGQQRGTVAVEESLETPLDRLVLSGVRRAPRFARALVRTGQALERLRVG